MTASRALARMSVAPLHFASSVALLADGVSASVFAGFIASVGSLRLVETPASFLGI